MSRNESRNVVISRAQLHAAGKTAAIASVLGTGTVAILVLYGVCPQWAAPSCLAIASVMVLALTPLFPVIRSQDITARDWLCLAWFLTVFGSVLSLGYSSLSSVASTVDAVLETVLFVAAASMTTWVVLYACMGICFIYRTLLATGTAGESP